MYKIFFASVILITILFSCSREKRQPKKQVIVEPVKALSVTAPFKVNVFLENSLSMGGYVNGSTDFKDATYSLLGQMSLSQYCRELNLYYINSNVVPVKRDLHTSDLSFVNKLTPKTFLAKGAGGMSSDLKDVLSAVLDRTDKDNMSVLISDFVFSPGKKNDAQAYLARQSIGIQIDITKKLMQLNLSVLVLRMQSSFDGAYYNQIDNHKNIKEVRPYYIWIIGSAAQIESVIKKRTIEQIHGGYTHKLLIENVQAPKSPDFKILYSQKVGEFRLKDGANGPIYDVKPSARLRDSGKFAFNVALNLAGTLHDKLFFTEPSNVEITPGFKLTTSVLKDAKEGNLQGFTHNVNISTNAPKPGDIYISYKASLPDWIDQFNSENDLEIFSDKSQLNKTFGIKALLKGVYEGFYPNNENNKLYKIKLTIK